MRKRQSFLRIIVLKALVVVACLSNAAAADPESTSYRSKSLSPTAFADKLTSLNYQLDVCAVTVAGTTGVCPFGLKSTLGFWSLLGNMMDVPISLMAYKNAGDPSHVDLEWSGQSTAFRIYRSTSPIFVMQASNLLRETSQCTDTDDLAGTHSILFYRVAPVAISSGGP